MPMRNVLSLLLTLAMAPFAYAAQAPPSAPAQATAPAQPLIIRREPRMLRTLALEKLIADADAQQLRDYIAGIKRFELFEDILQAILFRPNIFLSLDDKINLVGYLHSHMPANDPFKRVVSFIWNELRKRMRENAEELETMLANSTQFVNDLMESAAQMNTNAYTRRKIMLFLLNNGANANDALSNAITNANIELENIQLLLDHGAQLESPPDGELHPLLMAADQDRFDILIELINRFPLLVNQIYQEPLMRFDHEALPRVTILDYLQRKLANTSAQETEKFESLNRAIKFVLDRGGKTLEELEPPQEEEEQP